MRDLGSKNGVIVDGQRIDGPWRLHDGDKVILGNTELRIEDPEDRYLRRMQQETPAETPDPVVPEVPAAFRTPEPVAVRAAGEPSPVAAAAARKRDGASPLPRVLVALAALVLLGVVCLAAWLVFGG